MDHPSTIATHEIETFSDLPLTVEGQLDQIPMTLRQILELKPETTIKLPRAAGDHIDLMVAGNVVCSAEIILVNETIAVRVTEFREED